MAEHNEWTVFQLCHCDPAYDEILSVRLVWPAVCAWHLRTVARTCRDLKGASDVVNGLAGGLAQHLQQELYSYLEMQQQGWRCCATLESREGLCVRVEPDG